MANEIETFEQVYAEAMETTGVFPSRQTYAKRYLAAHKRELAAKDAEIARLKREKFDLNGCLLAEQELAEKRDALIKELADALNSYLIGECIDCGKRCEGDGACVHQKNLRALVKKALEVVSKTETTTEGGK